jgi:NADH-quinone oxidoreductase subunit N
LFTGWLALIGVGLALLAAIGLMQLQQFAHADAGSHTTGLTRALVDHFGNSGGTIFLGTLAADEQTGILGILFIVLLALVIRLSMAWSFTEDWGEYYALLIWATVGMMLLAASEELVTLFLTLETMTICLYLTTAFEKTRRRSAEGGLKYFVYGSVSSALFLFGLSMVYGLSGSTQFESIRAALGSTAGPARGLAGNLVGATALLLMLVGFGFKVAAVPFHQWAPDAYEGAPAPVTALIATGSKLASFVALMKVFLHALQPWSHPSNELMGPGWLGVIAIIAAVTMTYGNFAALAQRNLKRMLAYSSIAHAGYMLVGVAAASVSTRGAEAAGSVLFYLMVYAFANVGAFAVAAWLVRDKKTDDIDDLNGLGMQSPLLSVCIVVLMLSLIGIPPFAGFFGKLYMFMEALNQGPAETRLTLIGLVSLGLLNSVVSAFYYVRVLKALFLRQPGTVRLGVADRSIEFPILIGTFVVVLFGFFPAPLMSMMQAASVPMLTSTTGWSATISPATGPGYIVQPPTSMSGRGASAVPSRQPLLPPPMTPEEAKAYDARLRSGLGRTGGPAPPNAQPKSAAPKDVSAKSALKKDASAKPAEAKPKAP